MSLCQCLECGLILAKKLKVGLRVSRLLVSGSLGPTVVGHGGKGDFYCTKSGLGLRTDKSPIVNWELFFYCQIT